VRLFQLAMKRWANGEFPASESFSSFTARVLAGLRELTAAEGHGRCIAVVTSAGAISAVLMGLLGLSAEMMLKLCLSQRNTSISELRFRDGEESVISFNSVPHLPLSELHTFR